MRFFKGMALLALLIIPGSAYASDLTNALPGRCQRVAQSQVLTSPTYLASEKPDATIRRLRRCRTIARKQYIRSGEPKIISLSSTNTLGFPDEILLDENEPLHLVAASDPAEIDRHWFLWTFRYDGKVHFSTKPELTIQFPDDEVLLLRLWVRNHYSKKVVKFSSKVRVSNVPPTPEIVAPNSIEAGQNTALLARVQDPGPIDTETGFNYLWNISSNGRALIESSSSVMQYRFPDPGQYIVSLQVSDKDGGSSFSQKTVTVANSGGASPTPTPRPTATPKPTPQPTATPRPTATPQPTPRPTATPRPPSPTPTPRPSDDPPELATWEAQMVQYGRKHCAILADQGVDSDHRLGTTYYDAEWVYYQIAEYTDDDSWITCAQHAERAYRDEFATHWDGRVAGYWNFTHGLLEDFIRTGDTDSRDMLIKISESASYAGDLSPVEWTEHADYSREVAYTITSYLNAEKAGHPRRARLSAMHAQAHGHMRQWFVNRSTEYIRPFMVAITSQALIEYDEWIGDPQALPVIKRAMDELWETTWIPSQGAFQYTDRNHESGGTEATPDLNQLIAPVYAWLYKETGDRSYRAKADAIFAGGVRGAWLDNGKQYNQSYRWTFHYLRWRR